MPTPSPPSQTPSDDRSSSESHNYTPVYPETTGQLTPFPPPQMPPIPRQRALSNGQDSHIPVRSTSTSFTSSPLNPNYRSRPSSSLSVFNRHASEDATTLSNPQPGQRGSMILYRLAAVDDMSALPPPRSTWHNRNSIASTSDQSIFSLSSDSKYPSGVAHTRGLVPYIYDPDTDNLPEEDDYLHEPDFKDKNEGVGFWSSRGWLNLGALALLVVALLSLFICYPVVTYYQESARNQRLATETASLNNTGDNLLRQAPGFEMPSLVDKDTPQDAMTRTGWDGEDYVLVFSDEFNTDGRSFYPGDDPYWEAVNLWYWTTRDSEWYDPAQVTTGNGALRIKLEQKDTHGLPYRSGMLQSWNKFCFSSGYLEVSVTFPGPNSNAQGYVRPSAFTTSYRIFLTLAPSGLVFGPWATSDGLVTARLLMDYGHTRKLRFARVPSSIVDLLQGIIRVISELFPIKLFPITLAPSLPYTPMWGGLSSTTRFRGFPDNGFRETFGVSSQDAADNPDRSCTCPNQEHPGPSPDRGRGAPEIDVFEGERNKTGAPGGIVSQSAQFAPFTHDYLFDNSTSDKYTIFNRDITVPNSYRGSAVYVTGLTV